MGMKTISTVAALAVAAFALSATGPAIARTKQSPEAKLAKILDGRVAGKPVHCIFLPSVRNTKVIDHTAIVYDAGSVIYVNRPDSGAKSLDDDDVMVTDLHSSSLCNIDVVKLHDRSSGFYNGFVGLGDFVPYRRLASN